MLKGVVGGWSSISILSAALLASAQPLVAQEPDVQELRDQTREDIYEAYTLLTKHHPGMYNPFDPEFAERLEAARDKALRAAQTVVTLADRYLAVQVINQALADGHARIGIAFNGTAAHWAGFDTAWRGDGLYVTSSDQKSP